jgi:hypothetical protein
MKTKHEDIGFEMEDMFRECDAGGRRGETIIIVSCLDHLQIHPHMYRIQQGS